MGTRDGGRGFPLDLGGEKQTWHERLATRSRRMRWEWKKLQSRESPREQEKQALVVGLVRKGSRNVGDSETRSESRERERDERKLMEAAFGSGKREYMFPSPRSSDFVTGRKQEVRSRLKGNRRQAR
jgi:hypothetical protein